MGVKTVPNGVIGTALLFFVWSGVWTSVNAENHSKKCALIDMHTRNSGHYDYAYFASIHCGFYSDRYRETMLQLRRVEMDCAFPNWSEEKRKRVMSISEDLYDGSLPDYFLEKFVDNRVLYGSEHQQYKTKTEWCSAKEFGSRKILELLNHMLKRPNATIEKG